MSSGLYGEEDPAEFRARIHGHMAAQWLPEIVDDVLATDEIAAGIRNAGLDRNMLRQQVLSAREKVLAPAEAELDRAVKAAVDVGNNGDREMVRYLFRLLGIIVGLVGVVQLRWVLGDGSTQWLLVVGILAAAFGIAMLGTPGGFPATAAPVRAALVTWLAACWDKGVLPFVRRVLNEHLEPTARMSLSVTSEDAPGLHDPRESPYMVRTKSVEAFFAATNRLPAGAIGISGPRGVGKTSLIEHFATTPGRGADGTGDGRAHR